jgi:hypothetical protein
MSPTATIASVVVALVFFAWLFQSDTRDPGYEAWQRRQQEEQAKAGPVPKVAAMGIAVTDSGVTKDNSPIGRRRENPLENYEPALDGGMASVGVGAGGTSLADPATRPVVFNTRPGFGADARLDGTYVSGTDGDGGVVDDDGGGAAAAATHGADGDAAVITFRANGTFATRNMPAPGADETTGAFTLERGSGRYALSGNALDLTYTDGLARKRAGKRSYVVVPIDGAGHAPTQLAIQGRVFKIDRGR